MTDILSITAPRRAVTAAVRIDLRSVEYDAARRKVEATLVNMPSTVPIELIVSRAGPTAGYVMLALRDVGHAGPVHVVGDDVITVDEFARRLDPQRPRTIQPALGDPWAAGWLDHDEGAG